MDWFLYDIGLRHERVYIRGFIFPLSMKLRFLSLHFFFRITSTSFPFLSYLSFLTIYSETQTVFFYF